MKKIFEIYKNNKWFDYILILIIGLVFCIPFIGFQIIYNTHDGLAHIFRIEGTISALLIGEFPPLIAPEFCMSAGMAMSLFYAPIVTYLPIFINFLTNNYETSLKIFEAILIIVSGFTMYKFTNSVTEKRQIALISGILYMIVPYNLGNAYVRFAIGEIAGLAFMPIVWMGLYNLLKQDGKKHYLIAIGTILVILSHTVTTLYLAIFCIIYVIINIKKLKDINIIKKLAINLVFIITITMFSYLPILEAGNTAQYAILDDGYMWTNGESVKNNSLELKDLVDRSHEERTQVFIIGVPIAFLTLLSIYTFNKVNKRYKILYIIFAIFAILSLFMSTKLFPWEYMPNFLCKLQFAWRMLGFFGFFITFICAINLNICIEEIAKKDMQKMLLTVITLFLCIIYSFELIGEYKINRWDNYNIDIYKQEDMVEHMVYEYLPLNIFKSPDGYKKHLLKRGDNVEIKSGNVKLGKQQKNSLTFLLEIEYANRGTELEFPFIYYPGYEITLKEQDKTTLLKNLESEYGYIMIHLNNNVENASIEVKYKGTKLSKIAYIISLISALIFVIYVIKLKKANRGEV